MDLIKEGQKINIYFVKDSNLVEMVCSITEVCDDRLILEPPPYFMRYISFLNEGNTLLAKIFTKHGTIDFETIVISSPIEEVFSIEADCDSMKLTPGEELPHVSTIEPMEVQEEDAPLTFKTFEISSDYVRFHSNKEFSIGNQFSGQLILSNDYGIIKFKAEVSEIDPIYSNEITAKFITMTEEDRQNLLYYIYSVDAN